MLILSKAKRIYSEANVKIEKLKQIILATILLTTITIKSAFASSTSNDFDLGGFDDAVEGHIVGDVGRLLLLIGLGICIYMAIVKHVYWPFLVYLIVLLAMSYGPGIIDHITGS